MTSCPRRLALVLGLALAPSVHAIAPHVPAGVTEPGRSLLSAPPFVLPVMRDTSSTQALVADPALAALASEAGVAWTPRYDVTTNRLSFAQGTFPAWLPPDARFASEDERAATLAQLDGRCRALLSRHPGLFRIPEGVDLELSPPRGVAIDQGRVWEVKYALASAGVPVEGAYVFFRVNHGRLIQMGQQGVSDDLGAASRAIARFNAAQAKDLARGAVAELLGDAVKGARLKEAKAARLALLPWQDAGTVAPRLRHRLAWQTTWRDDSGIETWEAWHDATTGDLLALRDVNKYACTAPAQPQGRVVGGVFLGPIEEVPETLRGFPFTAVDNNGAMTTDVNGVFPYAVGNAASTTLSGTFFDMDCAGCTNPVQAFATTGGWGYLSLGTGGNDVTGNGLSTKAERNCFYHLGNVRQIASKHLDDAAAGGFFSRMTPATVNIGATCNAFWDGNGVNFFRAGGGCNNTGEIADVMQHEWGHGLDQFTGGGSDGSRGEGLGDTVGFMATHDPRVGPYFAVGDPAGIRNSDENVTGVYSTTNITANCPSVGGGGDGPLGTEVHCEGQIFSECWWHLARNMRQKINAMGGGDAAGWFLAEKLFFQSVPLSDTFVPSGARNTYDAVVAVDDNDGDPTTGIPDGTEINEAFLHHGMQTTTPVADSADCVPPAAPVISLSSAQQAGNGLWQVHVQWTSVPGTVEYRVFRNQANGTGADEQIATVAAPATDWFDDDVIDGATYYYRVMAFAATGCVSIVDNQRSIALAGLPNIVLSSWSFDDTGNPGANANGVAEPGETIVIPISALNNASGPATAVVAGLSTTAPGITIVRGSQALGDMPSGATRSTASPHFAIAIDRSVACGTSVPFTVSFQATEGCATSGFILAVGNPPTPCEAPEPRPRLRFDRVLLSDGGAAGGSGDASGFADPGESVRLPVDLTNIGNAGATAITGTLSLVSGPAGTTISDASAPWVDLAPAAGATSGGAPPHVEVTVPANAPCGSMIQLRLSVSYTGPAGAYTLTQDIPLLVGRIVETPALSDDFEGGDNGFTHGASCTNPGCDDFQHGVPTTASAFDPPVAHSGTMVWGNDLGTLVAQGSNGEYRRDTLSWLEAPPIDCTGLTGVKLSYWRWLTVEDGQYDHARVVVNGTTVWENPAGADTLDSAWTYMEHDISALADGQPSVTVRFELEADPGLQYGGWTLDDMRVFVRSTQCGIGNCPATGTPAAVGPALRGTGLATQNSVGFQWNLASPLQAGESWRVYRGTAPDAVTTRIATDLLATSFDDTNAPGALYFYLIVRANCLDAEGPADQ